LSPVTNAISQRKSRGDLRTNTNEINNITVAVIPAEAGIQKDIEKTGFPPARE
jgi:hypothetical protein